jgi:hypothetical protein
MAQEIIEGFVEEMKKKGFTVMKCPECLGALWLEGEKEIMLMRYSTVFDGECMKCLHLKKEMTIQGDDEE